MELDLVILLRLLWIAATLPVFVASLPISCLRILHGIISTISKRGKTPSPSTRFTVPHGYFAHFYVIGVCWTACLLGSTWFSAYTDIESSGPRWKAVFVLMLMEIQLVRRLYESYFVFKYDSSARMHVLCYLSGLVYYVMEPISLCSSFAPEALVFAGKRINELAAKGWRGFAEVEFNVWEYAKPLAKMGWCQWAGAAFFFWGWIHQLRCHRILGSLRKQRGAGEYMIPRGDWFAVSSSAHYLAEIVIYVGILLASGGADITVWLILAFVVANLVFAAAETHRWYLAKFEDYPRSRRAIIPLVY